MAYTKKQFLEDVKAEAIALRDNATDEEKSKLDFSTVNPQSQKLCIYGQMTGDCLSKRASHLIFKSCKRFVKNEFDPANLKDLLKHVNGEKITDVKNAKSFHKHRNNEDRDEYGISHFSSIESYIMLPNAKVGNLIDFIKGIKKSLVL